MTGRPLIAFAGGGSGGHLYPVLAVAEELATRIPGLKFVFFATDRPVDGSILSDHETEFIRQPVQPMPRSPLQLAGFLSGWRKSRTLCRRLLQESRPLAVLGSGGYASAPAIREARRAAIPAALLNPDAIPGKANRHLGNRVDAIFAQWEETRAYFNGDAVVHVTGCPVRPEFKLPDSRAGIEHFGLDPEKRVLLVTGASQGAHSVNEAMLAAAGSLSEDGIWQDWQVIHLTGHRDEAFVQSGYDRLGLSARVVGYTKHMAAALSAADLVVARAGASTLAEITAIGKPSILMPYPYHRDQHQVNNARVLVKQGAARMVLDQVDVQKNGPALSDTLRTLMQDSTELSRMDASAGRMGTANAAVAIADRVLDLVETGPSAGSPAGMVSTGEG